MLGSNIKKGGGEIEQRRKRLEIGGSSSVDIFVFREPEGGKVVETDILEDPSTDADESNMDVQKGYGAKDTSGPCTVQILPFQ